MSATRLTDRVVHRWLKLPARSSGYTVERDLAVPMRDGVVLLADRYSPEGRVPGTLLVRSPYGRAGMIAALFCRPFAMQGFQVVSVSCRATFGSGGEVNAFQGEAEDGLDTVAWMRDEPWFTGTFGTVGLSYLGLTQWAILTAPPPELRAAVIISGPHDTGRLMHGTGALQLLSTAGWTNGMLLQGKHGPVAGTLVTLVQRERPYRAVLNGLPMRDAAHAVWGDRAAWFDAWLEHRDPADPFWDGANVSAAHQTTKIPVLLYSGWHDVILEQVLESYAALRDRSVDVQLVVGPWSHADLGTKAAGQITRDSLAWFAEHLVGDGKRESVSPVRIDVGGSGGWRDIPSWPPVTDPRVLYLQPGGRLGDEAPDESAAPSHFRYDPADPTPAVGGMSNAIDAGSRDNTDREKRSDVLTFTTPPLVEAVEVMGWPEVQLEHTSDNPNVDLFVRLCEVNDKGRSWNVSEGYVRLASGSGPIRLGLSATAHRFAPGTCIRVQISGGAHPVYDRNPGTGESAATSRQTRPSTRALAHGLGGFSTITLPTATPLSASTA